MQKQNNNHRALLAIINIAPLVCLVLGKYFVSSTNDDAIARPAVGFFWLFVVFATFIFALIFDIFTATRNLKNNQSLGQEYTGLNKINKPLPPKLVFMVFAVLVICIILGLIYVAVGVSKTLN